MLGALLAWEHGSGRGHVVPLRTVAEAVSDRFTFDAALRDLTFKDELAGLCDPVQGPWLPYSGEDQKSPGKSRHLRPAANCSATTDSAGRKSFVKSSAGGKGSCANATSRWSSPTARRALCWRHEVSAFRASGSAPAIRLRLPAWRLFRFCCRAIRPASMTKREIVETINSVVPEFGIPKLDRLPEVYACTRPTRLHAGDARSLHRVAARNPCCRRIIGRNGGASFRRRRDFRLLLDHRAIQPGAHGSDRQPRRYLCGPSFPLIDDEAADELTRRGVIRRAVAGTGGPRGEAQPAAGQRGAAWHCYAWALPPGLPQVVGAAATGAAVQCRGGREAWSAEIRRQGNQRRRAFSFDRTRRL